MRGEVPLEIEGPREVHGIRRRQRVVETAVIGVRSKSFDGLNLVTLRRSQMIKVTGGNVIGFDNQRGTFPSAARKAEQRA